MALHPVVHRAAKDVVDLDLGVPVRRRHDARLLVADDQAVRAPARPCSSAGSSGACRHLTIQQVYLPIAGDAAPQSGIVGTAPKHGQQQGRNKHAPITRACAALALGLAVGPAGGPCPVGRDQGLELEHRRLVARRRSSPASTPSTPTSRSPSRTSATSRSSTGRSPAAPPAARACRTCSRSRTTRRRSSGRSSPTASPTSRSSAIPTRSPRASREFKRTELEVGDVAYAMPWDSGPVVMFYRRDFYEKAGVDPAGIKTWDDFIAAGKKVMEANPGVVMTQADLNGDTEWFRMLANEQGCSYFSDDGQSITVNQPACVAALDKVKEIIDAGADDRGELGREDPVEQRRHRREPALRRLVRGHDPHQRAGRPGRQVGRLPDAEHDADGPHAANLGGSSLAIPATSRTRRRPGPTSNYALGTNEGQVTMLREYGLVPSLLCRARRSVRPGAAGVLGRPAGLAGGARHARQDRADPRHAVLRRRRRDRADGADRST